ncbi:CBM96 family carbohydrate-binding protein [Dyadobacter sediminis]|uniref:DNRLRE domain-containing protein n=1 Tax=Dyadobacter sediminis TaxID=1493691 RepID=A0A5R9KJT9_9BACT|nr:malectin domain-containing carbohydrate-binding protein [Dyadobacter sediminis]TLU96389.1 DNRLRE domain-containing protein [Dyadobacter sediminis]GGB81850.1 hypothetical protein GCM10011325_06660 [Dyadobacter sediminis]
MHSHVLTQRFRYPEKVNRSPAASRLSAGHCPAQLWRFLIFSLSLLLSITSLVAQPAVEWDKIVGRGLYLATPTSDGGLIAGVSNESDYLIFKFNASGVKEWEKSYVGNKSDQLSAIIQTSDGGYLLGGSSNSDAGIDKSQDSYWAESNDFWIVKVSANGTKQWDKTFGGTGNDVLTTMKQATDGGYIIGGSSNSGISDVKSEGSKGEYNDYWVIKISSSGNRQWDRTIGGAKSDELYSIDLTNSGGYILGGTSYSNISGDKTVDSKGNSDYWIVQLSANGSKQWDRTIGGISYDNFLSVQRTADGGFILGGFSQSPTGADKSENLIGVIDFWIVKVNSDGIKQWDRTLGGKEWELLRSVIQTSDGGFIIAGNSESFKSGSKTVSRKGKSDYWIVKIGPDGKKIWDQSFGAGAGSTSQLFGAFPAYDGGYWLCGNTDGYDAANDKADSGSGTWFVKLLAESNTRKLSFSATSLEFTNTGNTTTPPQTVNLTANTGTTAVSVKKSFSAWLNLPTASLGSLSFKVDPSGIFPGNFKTVVNATAPGYARALMTVNLRVNDVTTPPTLEPIGNKELLAGQTLSFTATATAALGQTKTFSLVNAPAGAAIDSASGFFKWIVPQDAGVYPITVRVSSNTSPVLFDEETIGVKVNIPIDNTAIRINAGGSGYTTPDGRYFEADRYYGGMDRASSVKDVDILNTTDDEIYRSGRCSDKFNYAIPVRNGTMKVTLHFAEIFWGVYPNRDGKPGQRVFNVNAEGVNKLANYDIIARAGGPLRAVKESFEVQVIDGYLNLDFLALRDKPRVSAIEVEFLSPLTEVTLWPVADAYVRYGTNSGTNYGKESLRVKATSPADWDYTSYIKFSLDDLVEIKSAKIRLFGGNVESNKRVRIGVIGVDNDDWTEMGINGNNAPTGVTATLGSFESERNRKHFEVDITEFAKAQLGKDKVLTLQLKDISTRNNIVWFNSREASRDAPKLILTANRAVSSASRMESEVALDEISEPETESSVIYPNPVRSRFTLQISNQHRENIALEIINEAGRAYPVKTTDALHAGTRAEVNIADLALDKGMYLLKVQSAAKSEVLKLIVTE